MPYDKSRWREGVDDNKIIIIIISRPINYDTIYMQVAQSIDVKVNIGLNHNNYC